MDPPACEFFFVWCVMMIFDRIGCVYIFCDAWCIRIPLSGFIARQTFANSSSSSADAVDISSMMTNRFGRVICCILIGSSLSRFTQSVMVSPSRTHPMNRCMQPGVVAILWIVWLYYCFASSLIPLLRLPLHLGRRWTLIFGVRLL